MHINIQNIDKQWAVTTDQYYGLMENWKCVKSLPVNTIYWACKSVMLLVYTYIISCSVQSSIVALLFNDFYCQNNETFYLIYVVRFIAVWL